MQRTGGLLSGTAIALLVTAGYSAPRPNILMIAVDDLRPEMRCYGSGQMHTPNLDRLAARGVLFERAYCNIPVCGGSRSSLMSGLRPTSRRFRTWNCSTEQEAPGIETLNSRFRRAGYDTVSNGKVFNNPGDCQAGWSEPDWRPGEIRYYSEANQRLHEQRNRNGVSRGPSTEMSDTPLSAHRDGEVLAKSLTDLRRLAARKQPFFLAVGFYKPHLPFVAPRKYWELYDRKRITLPATYRQRPRDAPPEAIHAFGELRTYSDIPQKGPVSDEKALELIHGYYACVSMVDEVVGELLDELERLQLAENTLVVLWGDHGWFLGDHTMWCKHSCFERAMRVPLLVSGPGVTRGGRAKGLVELVDLYPTLCEMTGVSAPQHLQGKSFAVLLGTPGAEGKAAVRGRYGAGESVRTETHRYTLYRKGDGGDKSHMLFDLVADPAETVNIADLPDQAGSVARLKQLLMRALAADGR